MTNKMNTLLEVNVKDEIGDNKGNVYIKRVKRPNLEAFIELQDKLLYKFIDNNLAVGNIIASNEGWQLLKEMAALIPILQEGEECTLDLDFLEQEDADYLNNIVRLFFTKSVDDEDFNDPEAPYKPSLLAEFNHLDYGGSLGKQVQKIQEKAKAEQQKS
jgi:hypothetical protein